MKRTTHTSSWWCTARTIFLWNLEPMKPRSFYIAATSCVARNSNHLLTKLVHPTMETITADLLVPTAAQTHSHLFSPTQLQILPLALWALSFRQPCWKLLGPSDHPLQIERKWSWKLCKHHRFPVLLPFLHGLHVQVLSWWTTCCGLCPTIL